MLPWKVGFALAGGVRAEKTQACLVHNEISVAGASDMGEVGGWNKAQRSKVVCITEGLEYHKIQNISASTEVLVQF